MGKRIRLSGPRDLRATLGVDSSRSAASTCVVACPPHPQMGGDRNDARLRAVADRLVEQEVACLRIDYGPWDEGNEEQTDVQTALSWARSEFESVGLFGYSFGASVALLATPETTPQPEAISVLAPDATLSGRFDVADTVTAVQGHLQVVYGEQDGSAEWEPIVEQARECGQTVEGIPADHFFVGRREHVAKQISTFLVGSLGN